MATPNLTDEKDEESRFEATATHVVGVATDSTSVPGISNPAFTMNDESLPNSASLPTEKSHHYDKTMAATKTGGRRTCIPVLSLILLVAVFAAGTAIVTYYLVVYATGVANGPIPISSACNTSSCGDGDSGWSPWSGTTCTKVCGGGLFLSKRTCDSSARGGAQCTRKDGTTGLIEHLSEPCNTAPCPAAAPRTYLRGASGGTAGACVKIQAGLEKLTRGVDVVTVDMLPLDTKKSQGFKGRVIAYTCTEKKKRMNHITKVESSIPDQVDISSMPAGVLNSHTELHKSASTVKESHAGNLGLSVLSGLVGISGSARHMKNTITRQSKSIADTTVFHSSFQAHLHPESSLELTSHAKKSILDLPNDYHTAPEKFVRFIRYYGTHYFENGQFGGLWRNYMEINTLLFSQMTETEVKVQIESSVAKKLKDMGFPAEIPLPRVEKLGWSAGYGNSRVTIDERFMRNVKQSVNYYGGNVNIFSSGSDTWQRWEDSVPDNPWMFSGRLEPISSLIQDSKKKRAMEIAVDEHIQRAHLYELRDQCRYLLRRILDNEPVRNRVAARLAQINRLIAVPRGKLLRFIKQLEELRILLSMPDWFMDQTRLCFRWKNDNPGNPHECGYGANGKALKNLLCAKVNTMTEYYRDDTNDGPGGCEMQWKIQSDRHWPATSWFAETQICYHWKPEHVRQQCAKGAEQEVRCAKLNQFTAVYRDDTRSIAGGCQLHWRLKISNRAPVWMQTVQLCFEWFAEMAELGEWQCGWPGLPRKLCALAGQWTRFYRDDTHWRWGGCKMRWGIILP